uniref:Uncharacterized protein n=1 Tax=Arundo donax TaxID=35708 RepID=A0A0A9A3W4_ARUDO
MHCMHHLSTVIILIWAYSTLNVMLKIVSTDLERTSLCLYISI